VFVVPDRLWNCGGPALVEAIERLTGIAREVRGKVLRMSRTDAVETTGQKFDLPYGSLVTGLGALVVILFGASLAIGYLPIDLWQGVSDLWRGEWTPPALVLVELRCRGRCLAVLLASVSGSPEPPCRDCCAIPWLSRASSGCR